MGLSNRLKEVRGKLSRKEFGDRIGASKNSVQVWESGKSWPGADFLQKIHIAFNINLNWLITGDGDMHSVTAYSQLNEEESELIQALRKIDPISKKGVYLSAITQLNQAMREKDIRRDERKQAMLEKTIKILTKAVAEM